uniref:Uncharacterized protein n=1 Tax=Anguilla anguilla TaxID=7936 RepID=A0A0E9WAI2_ANGAN
MSEFGKGINPPPPIHPTPQLLDNHIFVCYSHFHLSTLLVLKFPFIIFSPVKGSH